VRPAPDLPAPSAGDRFELRGTLGTGGMGVVYRAYDRVRGAEVALKTLQRTSALDIYRFKQEFRALADLAHPSLVTLYELHTTGDGWFFTMELIDGLPFLQYVRPGSPGEEERVADEPTRTGVAGDAVPRPAPTRPLAPLDRHRLDEALFQLVDGVHALHLGGKLHCDLKPSNVLVEPGGRLVILDFGLVSDLAPRRDDTGDGTLGTPAYMSPEQAGGGGLGEASDWYSVGVILYEALTGRRPFEGSAREMMQAKQVVDPPPPRHHDPTIAEGLDQLCASLLWRDPAMRPTGSAIYAALGRVPSPATVAMAATPPRFVGRAAERVELAAALADSRQGRPVAMFVRARSGMGKSALLRQFLDDVTVDPAAIVLEGRCYEREQVPYKALDPVVDALASVLAAMTARGNDAGVRARLPRDVGPLARLFPVLRRVPAIAEIALVAAQPADPVELRRRAFAALRELLARLGEDGPLVIAIDDLQWGDADSAAFLADLLLHPGAILLVGCLRSEDEAPNPVTAALVAATAAASGPPADVRERDLGALSDEEALALVVDVGRRGADAPDARAIVRDCAGSPFFLATLARGWTPADEARGEPPRLDQVLRRHLERLPADARTLLALCAVATRPLRTDLALRAAGLEREGAAVATLRVERLVRVRRVAQAAAFAGGELIEPYHDRIRAAVVAAMSPAVRQEHHRTLATALETDRAGDHEALALHWLEAGEPARAGHHAAFAATAAEDAFAFHRAAELYRQALASAVLGADDRRRLQTRLGHVLTYAGRLDDAAEAFAAAAAGAPPAIALDLRRLEIEQRLRAGHLDENLGAVRDLLAEVGYRLPRSDTGAIASVVMQELLLRIGRERRTPRPVSAALDQRMQVLLSMSTGIGFVNPVLARAVHLRLTRIAHATGDPRYLGMSLWSNITYVATPGGERGRQRAEVLRERGLALARELDDRALEGLVNGGSGLASFLVGRWREAMDRFVVAEPLMRERAGEVRWPLDLLELYITAVLWYLGDTAELVRVMPIYLRDAQERGDRLAERGLRSWRSNAAWLVMGRPDEALAHVDAVTSPRAPGQAFQLRHFYEMASRIQIELYRGDGAAAHARAREQWRDLERSLVMRVQSVRIDGWFARGRAALAASGSDAALLDEAEDMAGRIEGEAMAWGMPLAALLRATVAHRRGDAAAARAGLEAAHEGFVARDMALFASVARRRLGELVGDGAAVAAADAAMRAGRVVRPEAIAAMLAPGW
jgi:hypothetical protein